MHSQALPSTCGVRSEGSFLQVEGPGTEGGGPAWRGSANLLSALPLSTPAPSAQQAHVDSKPAWPLTGAPASSSPAGRLTRGEPRGSRPAPEAHGRTYFRAGVCPSVCVCAVGGGCPLSWSRASPCGDTRTASSSPCVWCTRPHAAPWEY